MRTQGLQIVDVQAGIQASNTQRMGADPSLDCASMPRLHGQVTDDRYGGKHDRGQRQLQYEAMGSPHYMHPFMEHLGQL